MFLWFPFLHPCILRACTKNHWCGTLISCSKTVTCAVSVQWWFSSNPHHHAMKIIFLITPKEIFVLLTSSVCLKKSEKENRTLKTINDYSGSHPFYAKLWTVADQKPMVKKIWKKYEKSWDGLPSSPNQKEDKNPSGSYHNHLPPFFEDVGGCFDVKCAQLRVVELTTVYA